MEFWSQSRGYLISEHIAGDALWRSTPTVIWYWVFRQYLKRKMGANSSDPGMPAGNPFHHDAHPNAAVDGNYVVFRAGASASGEAEPIVVHNEEDETAVVYESDSDAQEDNSVAFPYSEITAGPVTNAGEVSNPGVQVVNDASDTRPETTVRWVLPPLPSLVFYSSSISPHPRNVIRYDLS